MSDHQKIHPVNDLEAPNHPTVPPAPRCASRSDHGESGEDSPPKRAVPYEPSPPPEMKKKRSSCCRSVRYTLCVLLLLVVILGATIGILYLVFKPKIPDYSVDRLELTRYTLNQNSSLSATFNVTIIAKNPNEKIGIYYEDGSKISVWYAQTILSEGSLPKFYQGNGNTTVYVEMTGQTEDAVGLMNKMLQQQLQTGNIPLRVRVNQPVRVKLGRWKLMEVRFLAWCGVAVYYLPPDNTIRVQSSSCKIRLRL